MTADTARSIIVDIGIGVAFCVISVAVIAVVEYLWDIIKGRQS